MKIIDVHKDDISQLSTMLLKFHKEGHQKMLTPCYETYHQSMSVSLESPDSCIRQCVRKDGTIAGLYIISRDRFWTKEYLGYTYWFYIDPDHRQGKAALMLARDMIKHSDDMDIKILYATNAAGISAANERALHALFMRVGFKQDIGVLYRVKE